MRTDSAIALDITAQTLAYAGLAIPRPFHGQPLFDGGAKPRTHVFTARDRCDETIERIRAVRTGRHKFIRNFLPDRPYAQANDYIAKQYPTLGVVRDLHASGKLTPVQAQWMAARKPDVELYDLQSDPHEVNNLAGMASHAAIEKDLSSRLEAWIRKTGDQGAILESPETLARELPEKFGRPPGTL